MKCQILRPYYAYRKNLVENSVKKIVIKNNEEVIVFSDIIQRKLDNINRIIEILEEGL